MSAPTDTVGGAGAVTGGAARIAGSPLRSAAPLEGLPVLGDRPRTAGEVVDLGVALVRFRFARLLRAATVVTIPAVVVLVFVGWRVALRLAAVEDGTLDDGSILPTLFVAQVSVLSVQSLLALANGMLVGSALMDWTTGNDPTARTLLGRLLRRTPALLGVALVHLLIRLGATGVAGPVAVVVTVLLVLAGPLVASNLGPLAATGRSVRLVSGAFRHSAATVLISSLVTVVAQISLLVGPIALVTLVAGEVGSNPVGRIVLWTIAAVISATGVLVVLPLVSAAVAVALWSDLVVRVEAGDLVTAIGTTEVCR